jgi:glycosyltransferase involved in cell wall biosynthesis
MLRVALNGRFTGTPQPTGTQTASFQLFNAILRESGETEFVVFADSRFPGVEEWKHLERVTFVETPFQDWSRGRSQFWEQFFSPLLACRQGCAIMHHPMTTSPAWQHGLRNVVTLHDLNFLLHPEWYSQSFRLVYNLCALPGLRRCARVVTISNFVKNQTACELGIPNSRLGMIYNGVKAVHAEAPWNGYYLFAAGSLQPHKNLARLIRAYRQIVHDYPGLELVVAGRPQPRFSSDPELTDLLSTPGLRLTGYLSEEELANAYAGARAFCYPSLEEGFGLPILEAMTLRTPVLTSTLSCLPEIAGPATQVDPTSVEAIARGLRHLLDLPLAEREHLIALGKEWAGRFSWKASAQKYLALYAELAS